MSIAEPPIDAPQGLQDLVTHLGKSPWIAIDTEFMRERTYFPKPCLLQIATPQRIAFVDAIALGSLAPLLEILLTSSAPKLFHAGRQDIEILYQLHPGETDVVDPLAPIFDTQIAASLLGYEHQIGYAGLVEAVLGIQLDKTHQRTDWSRRPLKADQLRYAADDVRHLSALQQHLYRELEKRGRLEWLQAEVEALADPANFAIEPAQAWQRVRGVHSLDPDQLTTLQALAAWREREAMARDKPRRWLLADEALIGLCDHPQDPAAQRAWLAKLATADQASLIEVIHRAAQEPRANRPVLLSNGPLSSEQRATIGSMMTQVRQKARQHGISPAAIATRSILERMVLGERDVPVMRGWRKELIGRELVSILTSG